MNFFVLFILFGLLGMWVREDCCGVCVFSRFFSWSNRCVLIKMKSKLYDEEKNKSGQKKKNKGKEENQPLCMRFLDLLIWQSFVLS